MNRALLRKRKRNVAALAASHANALAAIHAQTRATHALARAVSRACGHMGRCSQLERTVAHAAGLRQRTRHESSTLACVRTQTLPHARPCTRTPSRLYTRGRAKHTPSHAMSQERADSCKVALKVELTVAHAAGHRQRTLQESRTLTCAQTHTLPATCSTRCLARERSLGHASAAARNTRPRTRCLTSVRTHGLSFSKSDAL